jgi:hypothetical protein
MQQFFFEDLVVLVNYTRIIGLQPLGICVFRRGQLSPEDTVKIGIHPDCSLWRVDGLIKCIVPACHDCDTSSHEDPINWFTVMIRIVGHHHWLVAMFGQDCLSETLLCHESFYWSILEDVIGVHCDHDMIPTSLHILIAFSRSWSKASLKSRGSFCFRRYLWCCIYSIFSPPPPLDQADRPQPLSDACPPFLCISSPDPSP